MHRQRMGASDSDDDDDDDDYDPCFEIDSDGHAVPVEEMEDRRRQQA